MADTNQAQQQQQQHTSDVVVAGLNETVAVTSNGQVVQSEVEEVSDDLLQQALGVAVSTFQQETVEYAEVDGVVDVSAMVSNVDASDDGVATLVEQVQAVDETAFESTEYGVNIDEAVCADQIEELTNNDETLCEVGMIISDSADGLEEVHEAGKTDQITDTTQVYSLQTSESGTSESFRVTLVPTNAQSGAPLGSSQNPIRIIQQGNQYTPVQNLSSDQLSQIMQVVQQQQLAKTTQEGGGSSTLYNPDTNTRIVYRVIYPSELHKTTASGTSANVATEAQGSQTTNIIQKRTYKKRRLDEDDDDKADAPELSREEKEARKKHRPRTRSGRVSKPPKHMVKDYKHIHPLDWDEDPYDDSDGGYSDFKYSEDERGRDNEDSNDVDFSAGLSLSRPKRWKCKSCEKSYIGRGGLSRHYHLNPDHGKESDLPSEPMQMEDGSNSMPNGMGFSGEFSEDSNTQDSLTSTSQPNANNNNIVPSNSATSFPAKRGRGWPKGMPRSTAVYKTSAIKRKRKLKEFLKFCTDEELMEQVLPRLSKVITLWEFLLMKVEKGSPARPHVADAYHEFEGLHKKVQSMCQKYLKSVKSDEVEGDNSNYLQITDADVANSLGLEVGTYCVKTIDNTDDSFLSSVNAKKSAEVLHSPQQEGPRVVEVVANDDVAGLPTKRIVINAPANMASSPNASARGQLVRVTTSPGLPVRPQMSPSITPLTNGQKTEIQKSRLPSVSNATSQTKFVLSPQRLVKKTSLLTQQQKVVSTNTISMSNASTSYGNKSTNYVVSLPAAKPSTQPLQTQTGSEFSVTTTGTAPVLNPQSTQITIPVMLPQGTERVSLELPSSLAESILNNGIAQMSPAMTTSSEGLTTTSVENISSGTTVMLDASSLEAQSLISQQTEPNTVTGLPMQTDETQIVHLQGFGDVQLPANVDATCITQFGQQGGEVTEVLSEDQLVEGQIISGANIFQTEDGILIVQNPDGTTIQLQGAQNIPLETVSALLSMDGEVQNEQGEVELIQTVDFPS